MAANFVLLETIQVGEAGASSVTFNNIPQSGYTDLKIVMSARQNTSSTDGIYLRFNGDSTSGHYSGKVLRGSGSAAISFTPGDTTKEYLGEVAGTSQTASTFTNQEIYVPNYLGSSQKSFSTDSVEENNATDAYATLAAGLWTGTSAINSITFLCASSSLVQYSTFSLYGLAAVGTTPVIAPYASGGDIIETDGTYWYHAFLSSGTFTPAKTLSCDILTVAGGGGGSWATGSSDAGNGGGGAGGLVYLTAQSATANTAASVTVGAGGAGGVPSAHGASGSNSQFASLTAAIGGGFGGDYSTSGANGGSGGGGGAGGSNPPINGGTGSQGNNGGTASGNSGGGGGGYGSAGGNASGFTGGNGGAGTNTYSTMLNLLGLGVSGYIAGGGAGGAKSTAGSAGSGGGGTGGSGNQAGGAGTPNTGSGGGGAGGSTSGATNNNGGKGGSGLVIVRYAI